MFDRGGSSVSRRYVFVFAHYSASARLDQSTRGLLEHLRNIGRTILVSTNLSLDEARSIHPDIQVIVRENIGYDFYSYKVGLASIEDPGIYDHTVLLNSSFVCFDPERLMSRFTACLDGSVDALGLTLSRELTPHLQSYLIAFSRKAVMSPPLRQWWADMTPISDREAVIARYELGLSRCLLDHQFSISSAFRPSFTARYRALCQATLQDSHRATFLPLQLLKNLRRANKVNPTHFLWRALLEEFGVLKRELFEKNPFCLDLSDPSSAPRSCLPGQPQRARSAPS
ncbi:MAG: hypothetical protein C4K60_07135 [Ideonella sp. MAG2]|nr:MAG: hypothetical protein C4K60_07135 [Ideonella sp. MAG2]